jgi:hypothetical protein
MSILDNLISTLGVYKGAGIENRPEVQTVKNALRSTGICIDQYIDKIIEVDGNPRPIGFKFINKDVYGLKFLVKQLSNFVYDDPSTPRGKFNALKSDGDSFRQGGLGAKLHIEVGIITDCHIDSHQIAAGNTPLGGVNDFGALSDHASFDLGPELPLVSFLYFPFHGATFGPWIKVGYNRPGEDPRGPERSGFTVSGGYGVSGRF